MIALNEEAQFEDLDKVIALLNSVTPLSQKELGHLWDKDKIRLTKIALRMIKTEETYGVASGGHTFLNQEESAFKQFIKHTDNDLNFHLSTLERDFRHYLQTGEAPPPYYPWRIAVILSKAKLKDREKQFLEAWCRHFKKLAEHGGRYKTLAERIKKFET